MRNFSNLSKTSIIAIILFISCSEVFAPPAQFNQAQTPRRTQTPQEKRQQLETEAPAAMTAVDTSYKQIAAYVNSGQSPSAADIKTFLKTVATSRKYLPLRTIGEIQKSNYHLFSAWVYYFDSKQEKALKEAASAQKAAPENLNTVKTRLALSLIYKDYTVAAGTLTEQPEPKPAPRPAGAAGSEPQISQQPITDDFMLDVNAVKLEPLGKVFDLQPQSLDANSQPWKSAGKLTCALFWKIDANELDSYAPVEKKETKDVNDPNLPVQPESYNQQGPVWTPAHELGELSQLQSQFANDKRAVFAAVNLDNPAKIKNLENWLAKNRQAFKTFLLPDDQRQKAATIISDANIPTLLIVGPDSTIRYVGDANGFLPQMIIQNILKNPSEFASADLNEPNLPDAGIVSEPNLPSTPAADPVSEPNLAAVQSAPVEPNVQSQTPAAVNKTDVNTPPTLPAESNTSAAPVTNTQDSDDILAAANEYQAETLLSNARSFLQIGKRLPSHMYRNPVEMCRRVMKDYPNTKYSQEAQMLLRNVPKEDREQYKITDQELGL